MRVSEIFARYIELLEENPEAGQIFYQQHSENQGFLNLVQLRKQHIDSLTNHLKENLKDEDRKSNN